MSFLNTITTWWRGGYAHEEEQDSSFEAMPQPEQEEFVNDDEFKVLPNIDWLAQRGELVVTPEFGYFRHTCGIIHTFGDYPICGKYEGQPAAYIVALDGSAAAWFLVAEIAPIVWALASSDESEVQ